MSVQVAISIECMEAFSSIPRNAQSGVLKFFSKFRADPQSPGINYEKINDAADKSYRSVRIDQNFRGIVRKPDQGNTFLLMFVAKHDEAYNWARMKKCQINVHNGAMQVFESVETMSEVVQASSESYPADSSPQVSVNLNEKQLLMLGVPDEYIEIVHAVKTEFELERLQQKLPKEAYEAVYLSAMGEAWEQLEKEYCIAQVEEVDSEDFAAALARDVSQRFFKVVDGQEELQAMLESPLEHWRVFLHPSQRKMVEQSWNGPARVLGGAGTGKTVVAMHRAKWLASNVLQSGEKLLFTTFTANLATDIRKNLEKICTVDELSKIEVKNIDKWTAELLKRAKYPHNFLYNSEPDYKFIWGRAMRSASNDLDYPQSFYEEEWDRIIVPLRIDSEQSYFRAARVGRGVRLTRIDRKKIWPVFEELSSLLNTKGYRMFNQAMLDAANILDEGTVKVQYRSIIVDEGQDMGAEAFMMLRALVPMQSNDLFIVGDGHQRIYSRQAAMRKCGINIRGRGRKLKINYRTTEQTRRFASAILKDIPVDDMDGSLDPDNDYYSLTQGDNPSIGLFNSIHEECEWIRANITALKDNGVELSDICVVARTRQQRDSLLAFFKRLGMCVVELRQGYDERSKPGVRFATMHRVKGLEFRYVFIASVNEGLVPLESALKSTEDIVEQRARDTNERALMHVAATRAMKQLYISCSSQPSIYLENII